MHSFPRGAGESAGGFPISARAAFLVPLMATAVLTLGACSGSAQAGTVPPAGASSASAAHTQSTGVAQGRAPLSESNTDDAGADSAQLHSDAQVSPELRAELTAALDRYAKKENFSVISSRIGSVMGNLAGVNALVWHDGGRVVLTLTAQKESDGWNITSANAWLS
jgi:hypothetical protein